MSRRITNSSRLRRLVTACVAAFSIVFLPAVPVSAATTTAPRNGPVFFDRGNSIDTIQTNGTGLHRLASDGAEPWVSKDGKLVTFVSRSSGALQVMNSNGSGRRAISVGGVQADNPTFNPTATSIVFDDATSSVYTVNTDGSGFRKLLTAGGGATPVWATYSPNGRQIMFSEIGGRGHNGLFLVNSDGTNLHAIRNGGSGARESSFAPNGRQIVFTRAGNIYRMNLDGSRLKRLTTHPAGGEDSTPRYSPNGKRIVFERLNHSNRTDRLMTMGTDGSAKHTVIISHGLITENPSWQNIG